MPRQEIAVDDRLWYLLVQGGDNDRGHAHDGVHATRHTAVVAACFIANRTPDVMNVFHDVMYILRE